MAFLAPLLPALAGSAAQIGVSAIGNKLFGSDTAQLGGSPVRGVASPGLRGTIQNGKINVQRRGQVQNLLQRSRQRGNQAAGQFQGALNELDPRFAETISASQGLVGAGRDVFGRSLERLLRERGESVGTLRQNLSRRGILGSSFGEQAISDRLRQFGETETDLATQEALFDAQQAQQLQQNLSSNLFQETAIRTQLITQKAGVLQDQADREISQFNFETQIARDLALSAQNAATQGNVALAGIEQTRNQGLGAALQPVIGSLGGILGEGLSGLFKTSSPTPAGVGRVV